ncbi:thiamine phosphate synthase [Croceicoccus sp. BE223]|uniref:thiamine phosphate synthase n=1 Tax=Croceicoccus sp. BE223 TaxID=2817716 RepID=UPI0028547A45|nr:thiamine phosphate synthase [Croceicoccus sp. BE223]MDR7102299.1 thiamine-phosphate pyrophosphorylase [Croceicoccus sp. BE223]
MAGCYSDAVKTGQTFAAQTPASPRLPRMWLISDARNDARLETALARMPRGSGLIYRHYHQPPAQRLARFRRLARLARKRGIVIAWAGLPRDARRADADASYGPPLAPGGLPRLATVHSWRELGAAHRTGASLVLISPVFATRSHPGAQVLGEVRARLLARAACVPVIFLGGMTCARARRLAPHGWAAIDGLS